MAVNLESLVGLLLWMNKMEEIEDLEEMPLDPSNFINLFKVRILAISSDAFQYTVGSAGCYDIAPMVINDGNIWFKVSYKDKQYAKTLLVNPIMVNTIIYDDRPNGQVIPITNKNS